VAHPRAGFSLVCPAGGSVPAAVARRTGDFAQSGLSRAAIGGDGLVSRGHAAGVGSVAGGHRE